MGRRPQLRIYGAIVLQEANESSSLTIWNQLLPGSAVGVDGVPGGAKGLLTGNALSQAELCVLCLLRRETQPDTEETPETHR